jgi:plasmid maintenance system antidote protein VapI
MTDQEIGELARKVSEKEKLTEEELAELLHIFSTSINELVKAHKMVKKAYDEWELS